MVKEADWHNIGTFIFEGREGIVGLVAETPAQVAKECGGQFSFYFNDKCWCPSDIVDCEGKLYNSPATVCNDKIYKCKLGGDLK